MALVANYDSSDDSDLNNEEEEEVVAASESLKGEEEVVNGKEKEPQNGEFQFRLGQGSGSFQCTVTFEVYSTRCPLNSTVTVILSLSSLLDHNEKPSAISDDEDDYPAQNGLTGVIDDLDEDIPGVSSTASGSLFASLPSLAASNPQKSEESSEKSHNFVDEEEDLSSIPKANLQEKSAAPIKPIKKKRNGKSSSSKMWAGTLS